MMTLSLRPAALSDRRLTYEMMACSDATPEMMGAPDYPDHPVPSYSEYCADYGAVGFSGEGPFRVYFIQVANHDIGVISYSLTGDVAEIDMWISDRGNWGKGHGSAALRHMAEHLMSNTTANQMVTRPSARNQRAIAAYMKSGFQQYDPENHLLPDWCTSKGLDYRDAVVLVHGLSSSQTGNGLSTSPR